MKRKVAFTVLTVALVSLTFVQGAQNKPAQDAKAVQELVTLERQWTEAILKHDLPFFERVEAEEYTFTDPDGVVFDKKGDIEQIKSGAVAFESMNVDDLKVRLYGETAVVTGRAIIKGKINAEDISGQSRFTDVFMRRDGRWQCVASQATRIANPER